MVMPRRAALLIASIAVALCARGADAQAITATLHGVVRDTSQAVLPGVTIAVRSPDTGVIRTVATDATGRYVVASLPIGRYDLTAALAGFQSQTLPGVRLEVGQDAQFDFTLALGSITEVVTVTGRRPVVETTKTAIDGVVRREQIDRLPISGRTVANLAMLAPGVVPQDAVGEPVTTGAQPAGSTEILVDGVSNRHAVLGVVRANAPPDAVEEFQVLTGQYAAEFGNASGVVLNTLTRSGSNRLEGRAYYFHRDEALDARNAFATTRAAFEQKQGGGWLGGPIVVDRTHFFGSVEVTRGVGVATVNAALEKGDVEQPFRNESLFAKLTHQLTARTRLLARLNVDRPLLENQGVGDRNTSERAYDYQKRDYSVTSAVSTVFSSRALNELRVQYSDALLDGRVDDPIAYVINWRQSSTGKSAGLPRTGVERRAQLIENFLYQAGRHQVKVGADLNRVRDISSWWKEYPGIFTFPGDTFDPADPATYPTKFVTNADGVSYFDGLTASVSAFAQDSWRVRPELTLNLGARYDAYWMTYVDLRKANVGPRVGLAWDPFKNGKTAVRGGFGVFYNSIISNVAVLGGPSGSMRRIVINNPGFDEGCLTPPHQCDPFSRGTTSQPPVSVTYVQKNMPVPRSYSTTVGFQREVVSGLALSADFVSTKGRHLIRLVETNPTLPPTWERRDPTRGYVREEQASGFSDYQALWIVARKRWGARAEIYGSYTLSSGKATNESFSTYTQQDDRYPDDSYGYTINDERHRTVVSGSFELPWRVRVGAVMSARSGRPVDITLAGDINNNGTTSERPDLVPGVKVGTDAMRLPASFSKPLPGTLGNLPRNAGRGPSYWRLDVRLSKEIRVGKVRAEILAESFNVDNHVNLNDWVGNLGALDKVNPSFGRSLSADMPRQVQLGLRVTF